MMIRMRMLTQHRRQLVALLSDTTKEQACFLVCRQATTSDGTCLLVSEVLPIAAQDLLIHAPDQLSVSPAGMQAACMRARALGGAICFVHTHPMAHSAVGFSRADDIGNARTFRYFNGRLPGKLNSCLVFNRDLSRVAGRVYPTAERWSPIASVDVVDEESFLRLSDGCGASPIKNVTYDRQARLLGEDGQQILGQMRVAVIGCGGLGSLIAALLAHAGIGQLTLIDLDFVDDTNLPRLLGATPEDARVATRKVDVLHRYISAVSPATVVHCFAEPVEAPSLLPVMVAQDMLIVATDDTTSRAYLNQVCHQYLIPLVDMGVQFVIVNGKVSTDIGKVNLVLPSSACLLCTGHVNPDVLADEGLSEEDRAQRAVDGYLRGADNVEPSMMVFNAAVASEAAQAVVAWVTGLYSIDRDTWQRLRFIPDARGSRQGSLVRKRHRERCPICGHGGVVGLGDDTGMFVSVRPRNAPPPG